MMSFFSQFVRKSIFAVALSSLSLTAAYGAGDPNKPKPAEQDWSFAGPLGKYDKGQLQRGFKVYREVCSACHGLELLSFRNLMEPGGPMFTEAQVKAIASEYEVKDGPNAEGDMFERPGILSDKFPPIYDNKEQGAAFNGGAYPPDFSLIAKARAAQRGFPTFILDIFTQYQESGPDYLVALLTGYKDAPADEEGLPGLYYNPYFLASDWIAMAQPLSDDIVEYTDGTPQTIDQYSKDVAAFLMWAAEPKLEQRKAMGLRVMLFLLVFGTLIYLTKRKVWARIKH